MAGAARSPRAEVLRDILQHAFGVARAMAADGRPVPPALRPMLGMKRLAPRALDTIDRAGDDDEFRSEVAAGADMDEVSPAARLWLERPDGWAEQLDALAAERIDEADERDARRSLRREQKARAKAEQARADLETELANSRAEVERLRVERAAQAEALAEVERRLADTESARSRAVRELAEARSRHQRTVEDLRDLQAETAEAHAAEAAERQAAGDDLDGPARDLDRSADTGPETSPRAPGPVSEPDSNGSRAEGVGPESDHQPPAARVELPPGAAEAMNQAARAARDLAVTLAEAVAAFAPDDLAVEEDSDGGEGETGSTARTPGETAGAPRRARRSRPRRRRVPLPFAIHDDSAEAAHHLVRQPGTILLVDGYNVTIASWAERSLPEQRERLVTALDELEARVGVEITVVFDGVQEALRQSRSRRVRVLFTAAGVEADDVILDLIERLPADRPVVVASDDGRVRDGARARGAHTIGIEQMRSVLT